MDTVWNLQPTIPNPTENLQHVATLGQTIAWNVMDTDILQRFSEFRKENLGPFSLTRDWIANLLYDSTFCQVLDPALLSPVRRAEPVPDIYERWPTLHSVLDCVFLSDHYDDVASAVRSESMQDPVAAYLFVAIMAYWQCFQTNDEVPESINEREGGRTETAQIHLTKLEKHHQGEYKLARAMRDTWISHIRLIGSMGMPPRGLAIFGSASFQAETKLLRMDFQGAFRLQQFDVFSIPLRKQGFGMKMRAVVISCLELAARLDQDTRLRNQVALVLGFYGREPLANAMRRITKTSATPTKVVKTPKKK
ncbi:hypothetical protein BGZ93_004381 [Podila epicladia]|nr:hypothetical protein BGZ93_004381 [Podila epicladia]